MQDFKQLRVWQKGHALVLRIYMATSTFPDFERYGITGQMRRAAASIPANIAEGCGRGGQSELRQFLYLSAGSASELEYFLLLARDLRLLREKQHETLYAALHEIRRTLTGLIQRVDGGTNRADRRPSRRPEGTVHGTDKGSGASTHPKPSPLDQQLTTKN
jgi:four helix bundle protein